MDFQHHTQSDTPMEPSPANQQTAPVQEQQTVTMHEQQTVAIQEQQSSLTQDQAPLPQKQPAAFDVSTQNLQGPQSVPMQGQMPVQEHPAYPQGTPGGGNIPGQTYDPYNHNPYGNTASRPNGQSLPNSRPYQNNMPYGSGYPNNHYPGGNNNAYPYYNRGAYEVPPAQPGSSLANTAMILGIISILASFTFTIYPAFILGSIAIVLAILSKGSRSHFFQKARTGIICGTIGLLMNVVIAASSLIFVFTNPEAYEMFNQEFERIYGMSFDEIMDEMTGDGSLSDE